MHGVLLCCFRSVLLHVTLCRVVSLVSRLSCSQVFDDWKVHVSHALRTGAEADQLPRLSNVTLAFLEACCRADAAFEWRVFDVCAAMRQQSERKQQALLARPRKLSHHFFEEA